MYLIAVTAQQIGFWADKLLIVIGLALAMTVCGFAAGKKRRATSVHLDELEADRNADIKRAGPPRFNG
ncbi:MAG: hypothetical protein QOF78_4494 [Phycisphaerales bacterium]|jgi:hypothetical protein|nr:hypothetical protein [Phycisphaerales bacterium]